MVVGRIGVGVPAGGREGQTPTTLQTGLGKGNWMGMESGSLERGSSKIAVEGTLGGEGFLGGVGKWVGGIGGGGGGERGGMRWGRRGWVEFQGVGEWHCSRSRCLYRRWHPLGLSRSTDGG